MKNHFLRSSTSAREHENHRISEEEKKANEQIRFRLSKFVIFFIEFSLFFVVFSPLCCYSWSRYGYVWSVCIVSTLFFLLWF